MSRYTIVIDNKVLEEYFKYYFKKYPNRRVKPIDSPLHPSINKWSHLPNAQINVMKEKYDEMLTWLIEKHGYQNLKLDKFKLTLSNYYQNKRRRDNDNMTPKFFLDSLTKCGMIVDDDYQHLNPLVIYGYYDKENPRTEILIEELDE